MEAKKTDEMENVGLISVLLLIFSLFGIGFLGCMDKCLHKGKKGKVGLESENDNSKF